MEEALLSREEVVCLVQSSIAVAVNRQKRYAEKLER